MLKIRLRRVGKKGHPHYRVVVAENLGRRDGRFIENLGSYDPHASPPALNVNEESAKAWLKKGAQPSESVEKIFRRVGVIEGGPLQRKMVEKKVEPVAEAPAAKPAAAAEEAPAAEAEEAPAAEAEEAPAAEAEESTESEES